MNIQDLIAQKQLLERQISEAQELAKAEGIRKIKAIIEECGLVQSDIFQSDSAKRQPRGKVEPKYKNPETGQTWTGRGKAPKWIRNEDRNQFLIGDNLDNSQSSNPV